MLRNKVFIVTGASSGIGHHVAKGLLERGAKLVVNGREEGRLRAGFDKIATENSNIRFVAGDIGSQNIGKRLAEAALSAFGSIDVLVNGAGTFIPKKFLEATEEELDGYLATTVKGSFFASQAVIPIMQQQHDGCIINIGSMWVEHPLEATPCAASQVAKGGMHTLTRHLAIEFSASNIRVNTIAPAVIDTPLYDQLMDRKVFETFSDLHPLRTLGTVEDVAAWVYHLAGEGGKFVTGQTFFIDGGITAGSHMVA